MAKSKANIFKDETVKNEEVNSLAEKKDPVTEDIQDIDLSAIKKKKFRINGDKDKVLELNTSDLGIATRLDVAYKHLNSLMDEVGENLKAIPDDATEEETEKLFEKVNKTLTKLDEQMREQVDYIFNANVSELCASDGSMWDPIDGMFRFEHIIDALTKLYENNLNAEFSKMRARVNRKVTQYTKKHK